ncbi:MAG: S8 family serine peptidase [Acidobacteriaceae bacterium]|nr:S8 family serine peptidase [Acidobacteriaceae bacterium]
MRRLSVLRRLIALAGLLLVGLILTAALRARAQQLPSPVGAAVPHRYLIAYRNKFIPGNIESRVQTGGARIVRRNPSFGIAVLDASSSSDEAATITALRTDPNVEYVIHDRILSAHSLVLRAILPATIGVTVGTPPTTPTLPVTSLTPYDTYYTSTPQNWAVVQAGGYGAGISGGLSHGPWNTTMGAGVRIAILDSGVDANHPDIAPNLALNLSEIDQTPVTGLPSACDDGTAQDQQGHGTWTASLAAAAMGSGTGLLVGVAPAATILNIKVLERLPDPSSTATDIATQCKTGQASGMLSWVIQGIEDAIAQHASVISLSLGTLVDLETGEGAGLQATFDRVTYAADQAGAVVIASAGNDGVNLANPRYIELPAQSRSVLAVVASTNPACAENLTDKATCVPGPVTLPYYSNYGATLNAIAAPGGSYPDSPYSDAESGVSGWVRGACSNGLANTTDGLPADSAHSFGCFDLGHIQYVQAIGTSASAPLVAGAAALLRAANPSWTPEQVIAALRSSATVTPGIPNAPRLNLAALLP